MSSGFDAILRIMDEKANESQQPTADEALTTKLGEIIKTSLTPASVPRPEQKQQEKSGKFSQ